MDWSNIGQNSILLDTIWHVLSKVLAMVSHWHQKYLNWPKKSIFLNKSTFIYYGSLIINFRNCKIIKMSCVVFEFLYTEFFFNLSVSVLFQSMSNINSISKLSLVNRLDICNQMLSYSIRYFFMKLNSLDLVGKANPQFFRVLVFSLCIYSQYYK